MAKKKIEENEDKAPKKKRGTRDKKIFVGKSETVKVREKKRTGKVVLLPDNPTWIKQPNLVTLMSGDFTTLDLRVFITVIDYSQSSVEESIQKIPFEQLSLFRDMPDNQPVRFRIPYKDFGVSADSYRELKKSLLRLATIPVEVDTKDPVTGADVWALSGLFKAYIPKESHKRHVTIEIDREIFKILVNTEKGFTKYIKEIAFKFKSKYSVRMYLLISSWKDKGGFSMSYSRFKKWLRLEDRYPDYKDFYKRVIKPVQSDLFEQANCWFNMKEYTRDGETEPYRFDFKVVRAALTIQEQEYLKTHTNNLIGLMSRYLNMSDAHIKKVLPHITINNITAATEKVLYLSKYLEENWKNITSIPEYCTAALIKELSPMFSDEDMLDDNTEDVLGNDL